MITLRALDPADLDTVFAWENDPAAIAMAAFTAPDPSDRARFDAHYARIMADPGVLQRAIERDGVLVGSIASFTMEGDRELTYWVDPACWGQGVATDAVRAFLQVETTRPLHARVAALNVGSQRVLERSGFERYGEETSFADGVGRDVVELLYRLDDA